MNQPGPDTVTDDDLAFRFVTAQLSLALTATVGERWNRRIERLQAPADLDRWLTESGLLQHPVRVRPTDLEAARRLREAIYQAATRVIAGAHPSDADQQTINSFAAATPLAPELTAHGVRWAPSSLTAPAALSWLARDAIHLLGSTDRTTLRECANEKCGLLFTDTSRPRSRLWCSSERCGSAARSAEYRRRHKG